MIIFPNSKTSENGDSLSNIHSFPFTVYFVFVMVSVMHIFEKSAINKH